MADEQTRLALAPGTQRLIEAAEEAQHQRSHPRLGAHHWLLALLERHGPMAESLAPGLPTAALSNSLNEKLGQGDIGTPSERDAIIGAATERARSRGDARVYERDLAAAILLAAGYNVAEDAPTAAPAAPGPLPSVTQSAPQSPSAAAATAIDPTAYRPRATHPTPTLEQFGADLTRAAIEGKLRPVVGRADEVELAIETLCRRTKRNPVLVGPAGVGKTAIVEGLAQRIVRNEVPEGLRGSRLFAIQPSTLVAGAHVVGELDKRMKAILAEAAHEGILLFIDEVHSMVGAGGAMGSGDVASLLKPALARGDLACIAATTDDEYRRFVEPDAALERRFQPIRVQELTPDQTLTVLAALRDDLSRQLGVQVPDSVLRWLVEFADQMLRNRHFPDKGVDLLEQCLANALAHGKHEVALSDAEHVVQRMVGMPIGVAERLEALRLTLADRALLVEDDAAALVNRLAVTMRGLDLRPARPSAVVLLIGEAAARAEALSEVIAEAVFGSPDRVLAVDFARFVSPADVTMLVGAPPGYVGYSDNLPLHRLAQMPWCVVRCENVDAGHSQVLQVLTDVLDEGCLTDARGKRTYLSDAVILLTAQFEPAAQRRLGFSAAEAPPGDAARSAAEKQMGAELLAQVDLICTAVPSSDDGQRRWLEQHLLADLAKRYRKQGIELHWGGSLIDWLIGQKLKGDNQREWERMLDERLSPLLIQHLPDRDSKEVRALEITVVNGTVQLEAGVPGQRRA